jgi:energy-coupling factor transport system permease protein
MFDQLALGVYYPTHSLLHRLRARTKLLALLWLIGFVTAANQRPDWDVAPYLALVGLVCAAALLSGVAPGHLWRRVRLLALLTLVGAIFTVPLFEDVGTPIGAIGPLVITVEGVWLGVRFVVVLLSLYMLAMLLTMTTTPVALIEGLTLPVDEFALMTLLALRFIPTLAEEAELLVKAQIARGADFTHGALRQRLQSLATLFVPLLQGALRRATELATGLEARGYTVEGTQTLMHEGPLAVADYLVLGVVISVTVGALVI